MAQVELSTEEYAELTDNDDPGKWEEIKQCASFSSCDAPDLVFYIGTKFQLEMLKDRGVLSPLVLELCRQAYENGYAYLWIYA